MTVYLRWERTPGRHWAQSLLQQGHRAGCPVPHTVPHVLWKVSREICTALPLAHKCCWCSQGTFCVPACAHCLLSWYWAPLRRAWLHLLATLPSNIYGSPSSLSLSSWESCSSPFIFLMALHWTLHNPLSVRFGIIKGCKKDEVQ